MSIDCWLLVLVSALLAPMGACDSADEAGLGCQEPQQQAHSQSLLVTSFPGSNAVTTNCYLLGILIHRPSCWWFSRIVIVASKIRNGLSPH